MRKWLLGIAGTIVLSFPFTARAWTLTAVGDVMLDRGVASYIKRNGPAYPFAKINASLVGDIVLGNLEGPFTSSRSVATNDRLIFTFDPALAPALKQAGIQLWSLANNHTLNFGQTGLDNTRAVLAQNKLESFGDPKNRHGFGLVKFVAGQRIAFIGYNGLATGLETILNDIRESKFRADRTVVMVHWGNEYNLTMNARQRNDAHALIDAGADVIIGSHPHVVEPVEVYRGKFIAYSLGNFLFDQYFSQETQRELLLHLDFNRSAMMITFVPLVSVRSEIRTADPITRSQLLNRLAVNSVASSAQRQQIIQGQLRLP